MNILYHLVGRFAKIAVMATSLDASIRLRARELGFQAVGVTRVDPTLDPRGSLLDWIAKGHHGAMQYLAREPARRTDGRGLLATARSIVVVAAAYPRTSVGAPLAGYARLQDYHLRMTAALRALLESIQVLAPGTEGVVAVDTKPVLERAAAARAGIGFIGKNTMLMDVERGPWQMLGCLVLSLELEPDAPQKSRCGTCTRCLDACPTRAFVAPYVLDARRCLSYWTIEHRGAWPREFREKLGGRIFGCDDCLAVCPYPRRSDGRHSTLLPIADELVNLDPRETLRRCEASFQRHFKRYAIQRAGKAGLQRNAITALGNTGGEADVDLLERYLQHPDRGVRSHAAWSLGRIGGTKARIALLAGLGREIDDVVKSEIRDALAMEPRDA